MEYDLLIMELNSYIDKITLSKESEKSEYIPQFIELYGNPETEQITPVEPFYLNKVRETLNQLKGIRSCYHSNRDFYVAVSKLFA